MNKYTYDLEVFPNFFSAVFTEVGVEDGKTVSYYVRDLDEGGHIYRELRNFIKGSYLIGYNNKSYDDIILNFIMKEAEIDVYRVYRVSKQIIKLQNGNTPLWKDTYLKWLLKPYKKMYQSIDLMKILAFDKLFIGLKQCSVNLRHDRIQDLPKRFTEPIELWEVNKVLDYNKNDVDITTKLYNSILDEIRLREDISEAYDVDVLSGSRTYIAKAILNHYYGEYTGINYFDFKDLRTYRDNIKFKECISDNINYQTPLFNDMLNYLKTIEVVETKGAIDYNLIYKEKGYKLGTGGLHSIDKPAIFEETDEYYIIDADVASFYPRLMINEKIKPEHLQEEFTRIVEDLTDRRLKAKSEGDYSTADALKISINSMFGLLGFKNYWLYDPKAVVSTTINGQLYLLMLIERLVEAGFEVISANTDGVTAKVPKDRENEYYEVCEKWEEDTNFELEYAYYSKYVRRDVNNYITKTSKVKEKGQFYDSVKVKKKGAFVTDVSLQKAFKNPIVPIAIEKYYLDGTPVIETLRSHNDIYDFCKSQKTGNQFKVIHRNVELLDNGNRKVTDKKLQKTNRYFVSKTGGTLLKIKNNNSETNMELGYLTTILNDFDDSIDYVSNIDFAYYEREINKIINLIDVEVSQTSLF